MTWIYTPAFTSDFSSYTYICSCTSVIQESVHLFSPALIAAISEGLRTFWQTHIIWLHRTNVSGHEVNLFMQDANLLVSRTENIGLMDYLAEITARLVWGGPNRIILSKWTKIMQFEYNPWSFIFNISTCSGCSKWQLKNHDRTLFESPWNVARLTHIHTKAKSNAINGGL